MKNVRRNSAGLPDGNGVDAEEEHGDTPLMVQQLAKEICNIVLMDIDIPGIAPTEIANILKTAYPEMNVVVYTLRDSQTSSEQITPDQISITPPAPLSEFITTVYESTLKSNLLAVQKVFTLYGKKEEPQPDPYGLSSRERQVLECLVDGDTYKMIAEHCHISVGTVRSHIMNIYRKLNVNSRSNAIVKAMQEHLTRN